MDLLSKYKEEIAKDLVIDDFNIKDVQTKLPSKKHFWAARLIDAKIKLHSLQKNKKILKKTLVARIISESPTKINQQTAEIAAENSKEVAEINDSIKEYEFVIEYLEKVEKIMQTMHWEIKNILDIQKLEQL